MEYTSLRDGTQCSFRRSLEDGTMHVIPMQLPSKRRPGIGREPVGLRAKIVLVTFTIVMTAMFLMGLFRVRNPQKMSQPWFVITDYNYRIPDNYDPENFKDADDG